MLFDPRIIYLNEEQIRQQRWDVIRLIYATALKREWYLKNFHDKFSPNEFVILSWPIGADKRSTFRLPL